MPPSSALERVQRESRARVYPSLRNRNWLILRRRQEIFEAGLSRVSGDGLSVLDIGGRLQPYRPPLGARTKCYVAVDLQIAALVNVRAAAEALRFREEPCWNDLPDQMTISWRITVCERANDIAPQE